MASFEGYGSQSFAPSAPTLPEEQNYTTTTSSAPPNSRGHHSQFQGHGSPPSSYSYGQSSFSCGYGQMGSSSSCSYGYVDFPPGMSPDVVRSLEMVDRDRSGFIDDNELQQVLSSGYQRFSLRTIRLLISLFKNPNDPAPIIGPKEFDALWNCLGQWRGIFERYDKDRSGRIDVMKLRDVLYGLGYAVPGSVLQLLNSKYDNGSGRRVELDFNSFVECGMIVKGLTEKFKEKDPRYTGSATFTYDAFMSMVIPFLVSY